MKLLRYSISIKFLFIAIVFLLNFSAFAQEEPKAGSSAQELADKMANPVANLISVPLQNNLILWHWSVPKLAPLL